MTEAYAGRCQCGSVSLIMSGAVIGTRQCWCSQCQKIASGGPTHNAIFDADDVAITGSLEQAQWTAASGNILTFHFCPQCGTQIYAQSSARPHLKTVRFGALDAHHGLTPQVVIWTENAPDWAVLDPSLEQWPQQPPAPLTGRAESAD